ncbi:DUF3575 domain-containing protein [Flavobacterium sp. '19STA2R22 D10 B1']|uniref:DUF3575 domain-containing protein n=1 Tax=Flavobacterium aerium TaxID=3037261 RepID=UPI00278BB8A1|nr:DUF3575 domain-containing protein [Flavobacterium sp. '19STA2R22 D10 B1']
MKKVLLSLIMLASFITAKAQSNDTPTGEIKLNFLNTILIGSVEVGYEHFIDNNQSIGIELFVNDRFSYMNEKKNKGKEFKTNSISASYNFYLSEQEDGSGWVISPFFKYRFGNHEEKTVVDNIEIIEKTDMNSPILGLGTGYKWIFKNKFTMGPYASIGRNFSKEVNDRFAAIEFNAGFGIGYRF